MTANGGWYSIRGADCPESETRPDILNITGQDVMTNSNSINGSPIGFFLLTFLLSVPFYILNALAYRNVVGGPEMGALYIALFTVTPISAASILTYRRYGSPGLKKLIGRIFDFRRTKNKTWYIASLFLMPFIFLLSLGVMRLSGLSIPPALTPLVALPAVFLLFFILATGEELGWMGYAFESMQSRGSALRATLILGTIWAFWHVPFFVFMMPDPIDLGAHLLTLIGTRVILAWIFNNTGRSVFAAILLHAADNTALTTMPEIDAVTPWGVFVHCGFVLVAAVVITLLWGPRTLAKYKFGH